MISSRLLSAFSRDFDKQNYEISQLAESGDADAKTLLEKKKREKAAIHKALSRHLSEL